MLKLEWCSMRDASSGVGGGAAVMLSWQMVRGEPVCDLLVLALGGDGTGSGSVEKLWSTYSSVSRQPVERSFALDRYRYNRNSS